MKKSLQILTLSALLGSGIVACHKKENAGTPSSSAAVADEAKMKAAYGFLAQVPSDVESACAYYHLGAHVQDFLKSKTWQSIAANPLVQPTLAKAHENFQKKLASDADFAKLYSIAQEAANHEIDIVCSSGWDKAIQQYYAFSEAADVARIEAVLNRDSHDANNAASAKNPAAPFIQSLTTSVSGFEIPSGYIALNVPMQKMAVSEEIEKFLAAKLPKEIQPTAVTISGTPFKSVAFTIGQALTPEQKEKLKTAIANGEPDAQKADADLQAILGKHVDITYGALGDYFIVSVGADHAHLKFADKFSDSILAMPAASPLAAYADKSLCGAGIASKALVEAARHVPQYSGALEKLKPELAKNLSPQDSQKLTADVKRIDGEIATIMQPKSINAVTGVEWIDKGYHGESFGGAQYSGAQPLKFAGVPTATTLLWLDAQRDSQKTAQCTQLIEDIASTGYDLFQKIGVQKLSPSQRMNVGLFQNLALPKVIELYKITRDQLAKSFGTESALAIDLNGAVPPLPQIPPAIQKDGRAPRIAVVREVKDPALLAQSWQSYLKTASDALMATPFGAKFPQGLPQPQTKIENGTTLSFYPLPLPTGDLLPVVATNGKTAVYSTSPSYAMAVSEAAAKSTASAKAERFDFKLNAGAGLDYAQLFVNLAAANPDLFFTGANAEQNKAEFLKNKPNIDQLLQALHAFSGVEVESFEENGQPRTSISIPFND